VSDTLSAVCVYCASSPGVDPAFHAAAASFGRALAERQLGLVYGGGHVGLMGVLADAVLSAGGSVHGVMTRSLVQKEVAHQGLTAMTVVETMHERKAAMADLADGFVMLPGGFGTLDEFFEVVTWTQLGIHAKSCGILNVSGFFDSLLAFVERAARERLVRSEHRDMLIVETDPTAILDRLGAAAPVTIDKWLDRSAR
jgi:uncharacterized protein (TIGR00730 family)